MLTTKMRETLDAPLNITADQIKFFQKNGFIKLKNVLSAEVIQYMNETISAEVKRLNTQHLPIDQRDTYGKAFLQIMNLWTKSDSVKEIVSGKRLAKIATDLLGRVLGRRLEWRRGILGPRIRQAGNGFSYRRGQRRAAQRRGVPVLRPAGALPDPAARGSAHCGPGWRQR